MDQIQEIIVAEEPDLMDNDLVQTPPLSKRRWYDKDPYSWILINCLKYAKKETVEKVVSAVAKWIS